MAHVAFDRNQNSAPNLDQYIDAYVDDYSDAKWFFMTDSAKQRVYDEAKAQWQVDYDQWASYGDYKLRREEIEDEREYNSPENQMSRYLQAGMNPNTIFGQVTSGNVNDTANINTPGAPTPQLSVNDKTERISRLMSIIGGFADLFSKFEGVKNQSLQNQLLEGQMPALIDKSYYESQFVQDKYNALHDYFPVYGEQGELVKPGDPQRVLDLLFPQNAAPSYQRSRQKYQDWWTSEIAPIYKSQFEGKTLSAEEKAKIDQYNREQLESFPPAVRPFVWLLSQMFGMFGR